MKKLNFSIKIKASREKVWDVLWNDATYRQWTSAFSEGSYAVSDWKEGSKILFLSSKGEGMFSIIAQSIPNEFMSFNHLGVVKNFKEEPFDEQTKKWSGAMENYALKQAGEFTELLVEMDITENFLEYFKETFPKALDNVKTLAQD